MGTRRKDMGTRLRDTDTLLKGIRHQVWRYPTLLHLALHSTHTLRPVDIHLTCTVGIHPQGTPVHTKATGAATAGDTWEYHC